MIRSWKWVAVAALVGFVSSGVSTSILALPRHGFIGVWTVAVVLLWLAYARAEGVHLRVQLARHLTAGLIVGGVVGALLVATVLRQPASSRPDGLALGMDIAWLGAVYGSVDALILAVLPVVALYGKRAHDGERASGGRLRSAAAAVFGSALITAAYHLGFREFQGPQIALPVIGGVLTTIAYLLSGSALAPILAHVMMHVAAVLHGAAATVQLPPHY